MKSGRKAKTQRKGHEARKRKEPRYTAAGDVKEFAAVQRERNAFDPTAWHHALAARRRMPALGPGTFDPGPDVVRKICRAGRPAILADRANDAATVATAKAPHSTLGLVAGANLSARRGDGAFLPGTIVLPITAQAARDVDPRTLHLFRWDVATKQYQMVPAAGVNLDHGYVWGRVSRAGWYGVFGLPSLHALDSLSGDRFLHAAHLLVIILRFFSPTGPWQSLGPRHLSCCIADLALDPSNTDRIYAAASDGGLWRLDSVLAYPGVTWTPLTDQQPSLAINCVAVSPADSRVVYYADRSGLLYRSDDRGDHWSLTSATSLGYVWRLLADPSNADTIYAASNSGMWCSRTGGASWVSNPGSTTLRDGDFTDAAFDPDDPAIIYACQRSVGLLKSMNSGGDWRTMLAWSAATAPAGTMIKVAVGGLGTDATRTVAVKFDQEVFVNRHGGRPSWIRRIPGWVSRGQQGGNGYGDWCHVIAVDPFDDNVILAGAQEVYRTADGGGRWTRVITYYTPHEDQHRLVFDPTQRDVVYAANDGGVYRSSDGGVTWQTSGDDVAARRDLNLDLVTAQFYTAGISGDHAVGDAYHQGLLGANSLAARDWAGIEGHSWEFANVAGDPMRAGTFYILGGSLFRRGFPSTAGLTDIGAFRASAVAVDEQPGSTVVLAATGGMVNKTGDVTAAAPAWSAMAGIALVGDSIVALSFAPTLRQRAFALSSGGRTFACADVNGTAGWTAGGRLPAGRAITVSRENADHVFAISNSQVFRSINAGVDWTPVPGSGLNTLPPGLDLRSIVAGPDAIYLAAAVGVFMSPDEGEHWFPFNDGLPNAEIKELLWTANDLFAVTHGRALWHHGRYLWIEVPPIAREPDIPWLIELWHRIHGGDPAPDAIRSRIGWGYPPAARIGPAVSER